VGLKFHLLGTPYITWNDTVLDVSRRQVRVLLYYLASYPNAVPQERLHYLFWADKSESECRRNLSHLLTHARSSLPEKDIFISKDSLIMLDPQKIWCDVVLFKDLIRSAQKNNHAENFKQAADYYRGPFLDGLQFSDEKEFENLIELERFNLERNYLNLLYKLILIEKQDGDNEAAIEYAYQYLARDNLSEEVHRQLITLHGLTGNRERALAQYQICKELLEQELHATPSMKTRLAYQHILADTPPGESSMFVTKTANIRPVKPGPLLVSTNSYNEFINLFDGVLRTGHGGTIMLYGELGIGKSNLLTKVLQVTGKGKIIVRAQCDPGVQSLSYWPIKNLLMRESNSRPSIKEMMAEYSEKSWVPIDKVLTKAEDIISDPGTKDKLFTLMVNSILALADESDGLILCVEDMEWADTDSLELFLYLNNYSQNKKIWLIGSYCCPENNYLIDFLKKLQLSNGFMGSVKMQGMSNEEIASTIKIWVGDTKADPYFIERLYQLSGGNPFFVSEIMRWIVESSIPLDELLKNNNLSLPPTIFKTVDYRLSRLSQEERRVLEIAAVIGLSFKIDRIREFSDLSIMQILDALDELVNRHFLFVRSTHYQFVHELIRQAVLEGMSPARKQFLIETFLGE